MHLSLRSRGLSLVMVLAALGGGALVSAKSGREPQMRMAAVDNPKERESAVAWRSVYGPSPFGQEPPLLSLNPLDASKPPLIWNPASNIYVKVRAPAGFGNSYRLLEVRGYSSGLAAARVSKGKDDAADGGRWGYIDTSGAWRIPPRFLAAGDFAGAAAVVAMPDDSEGKPGAAIMVIDAGGNLLYARDVAPADRASKAMGELKLVRAGQRTLVWRPECCGLMMSAVVEEIEGKIRWTDLPGAIDGYDPGGSLLRLRTPYSQYMLWQVGRGEVKLADYAELGRPLTPDRYAVRLLTTSHELALKNLKGEILARDLASAEPLADDRFMACTTYGSSLVETSGRNRRMNPGFTHHRCGIMDAQGQWWLKPEQQMIDLLEDGRVRVQSGTHACVMRLSDSAAVCDESAPAPTLDLRDPQKTPRTYGYPQADAGGEYPYDEAGPYAGDTAIVTQSGEPGLIDRHGAWMTPRLSAPYTERMQRLFAVAHYMADPYTTQEPHGGGMGVIDGKGREVIPLVFSSLQWFEDRSLLACNGDVVYPSGCRRLDIAGKELPPAGPDVRLLSVAVNEAIASAAEPAQMQAPRIKPGDWRAISENGGKWGYQNADGAWMIAPRFDDAMDFSGGVAAAARLQLEMNPDFGEPRPAMRWGLIDAHGKWIVESQFISVRPWVEGTAVVLTKSLGLIDRKGRWLHQPEFKQVGRFQGGEALAQRADDTLCRLQLNGNCLPLVNREGIRLSGGGPLPRNEHGAYGYAGADGSWVIQPQFSKAEPFFGEHAIVRGRAQPPKPDRAREVVVAVRRLTPGGYTAAAFSSAEAPRWAILDPQGRWLAPVEN